jgi:DNA-binding response OmpR family regulator
LTPARTPASPRVNPLFRPEQPVANRRVLLASHDATARAQLSHVLGAAGYEMVETADAAAAQELARVHACDVVLLDTELPDASARRVCRLLKADADLSSVPVLFVTSRVALERPAPGLVLDADDYVIKPVAPADLLLRLRLRLALALAHEEPVRSVPLLDYHAFVRAADDQLARGGAALVLLTVGHEALGHAANAVFAQLEPHDLLARRGAGHLLMLLPEVESAAVTRRLTRLTTGLIEAVPGRVHAGVAVVEHAGANVATLLAEADQALADARAHDLPFSRLLREEDDARPPMRTVVVADDDAGFAEIVRSALRDGGCRPVLVESGQAALRAVLSERPDVLVLDLGLPGLTGLDVLSRLQDVSPAQRPRLLVLSADRGMADVEKAFALGASDYLIKPFDSQELVARVARLV